MKTTKFLFLILSAVLAGCSNQEEPVVNKSERKISITATAEVAYMYMAGADSTTIDWGDGTPGEKFRLWKFFDSVFGSEFDFNWPNEGLRSFYCRDYVYPEVSEYTITLTGGNITHFTVGVQGTMTGLDLSGQTELKYLECGSNQLTNLDVSKNIALAYLGCFRNQLTNLDLSKNIALTYLECDQNQLTNLDVSKNIALTYLGCSYNQLTNLDLSKNIALTNFHCINNQLTNLDLSEKSALKNLNCTGNQLTDLDVSKSIVLSSLSCNGNQLTDLDLSENIILTRLECQNNNLSATALNNMFETLNDMVYTPKRVYIANNPGTDSCDPSIATGKGWIVLTESYP